LKQRATRALNVVVIERDPAYTRASTTLSVGGLRQQFSLPENIQMSMFSADFLRNIRSNLSVLDMEPPDINFNPHGYLYLSTEEGAEDLTENHKIQTELGASVDLLTSKQLKEQFPWLNTQGIALGCHGIKNEGWFDPWSLLNAFKRKALSLGTTFVNGEVVGFDFREEEEVYVEDDRGKKHAYEYLERLKVKTEDGTIQPLKFAIVIVAAGAYSGEVARLAKIGTGPNILKVPIPVEPRKRYVFVYHCPKGPGIDCPLVIDPTRTYFRREGLGGNYLGGCCPSPSDEPDTTNLDVDYTVFENQVWPTLANRIPCFEAIKLKSAWAGYYDYNTFDQNGIIGPHPYYPNMFLATGFSGHGIQQAPAVGRAIMELIIDGEFKTIDLSRFNFNRVISNNPLYEKNII